MAWIVIEGADFPKTCNIVLDSGSGAYPVTNKVFETEQEAVNWANENVLLEWTVVQVLVHIREKEERVKDFTGCATKPEDLEFREEGDINENRKSLPIPCDNEETHPD